MKYYLLFLFLIIYSGAAKAQKKEIEGCKSQLAGYITDTQEFAYKSNKQDLMKYDVIFYPNFNYRVILCTKEASQKFEICLIDEKGNVQYTNQNNNYSLIRDFRFSTLFHGVITVKSLSSADSEAKLVIGFKKTE